MEGAIPYSPRTVEEVFKDFKGRRAGMIKALTTGSFSLSLSLIALESINFFLFSFGISCDIFDFSVADVDKFYQQCDPGEFSVRGIRVLLAFSSIFISWNCVLTVLHTVSVSSFRAMDILFFFFS